MKLRTLATAAAAVATIAVLAAAVPLAVPAQTVGPQPQAGQSAAVDDTELKSFAVAVKRVKRVADSYLPRLAESQTIQETDALEDAAYLEVKEVVENEGFSVSRFNQILAMAGTSPDIAERIRSHLQQTQVQ
jgi:predicted ATPase with chaperone activity